MSPLVQSLLEPNAEAIPHCTEEVALAFGDGLFCTADLTTLRLAPEVAVKDGIARAAVRAWLNGTEWLLGAPLVMSVAGRLLQNPAPTIARRQMVKACVDQLADAAHQACVLVLAHRQRGAA